MMIIPTIELMGGHCVTLNRGNIDDPVIWHVDAAERARSWAAAGAAWLHVTDLDAVRAAEEDNRETVMALLRGAGLPVQVGGGIRSLEQAGAWIEAGAGRVVIGATSALQPDLVKRAARRFPDQVVLAVDIQNDRVMSNNWTVETAFDPVDFISAFETDPLAAIIVTDIDAHIGNGEAALARVTRCAEAARAPVLARGTIRGLDDISRLKYVPRIAGALVGEALFDRSIDLAEALAVAAAPVESPAPFV